MRMVIYGIYMYMESRHYNVHTYMQDVWFAWPSVFEKTALKAKLNLQLTWDSFRLNLYSISLLVACEFLNGFGNLWIYFICANFGIIENLISIVKGLIILAVAIPLCVDVCFIMLQKVTPEQLVFIIDNKVKNIQYIEGVVNVKSYHVWSLDKSYRVCSMNVEIKEDADADGIRQQINKKLLNKYCEKLTLHIIQ